MEPPSRARHRCRWPGCWRQPTNLWLAIDVVRLLRCLLQAIRLSISRAMGTIQVRGPSHETHCWGRRKSTLVSTAARSGLSIYAGRIWPQGTCPAELIDWRIVVDSPVEFSRLHQQRCCCLPALRGSRDPRPEYPISIPVTFAPTLQPAVARQGPPRASHFAPRGCRACRGRDPTYTCAVACFRIIPNRPFLLKRLRSGRIGSASQIRE